MPLHRRTRSSLAHAFSLDTPFDPNLNFISSSFFSVPLLGGIRLAFGVYTLIALVVALVWDGVRLHNANSFFSYFTHLSYIGLCAYLFASGMQSSIYAYCPFRKGTYVLSARWPRVCQFLHVWLYSSICTFPIIVTIVYWSLLSGPETFKTRFNAWSNISMHALNTVFALFEILLTNVPPPSWSYLPLCIVVLACYLGVAYITHATLHFYTYSFLDPKLQGPRLAAYMVGVGVGECVIYAIVHYLVLFRQVLTRRYYNRFVVVGGGGSGGEYNDVDGDMEGKRREEREELNEWQQVSVPESGYS